LFSRGAGLALGALIVWLVLAALLHAGPIWAYAQRWAMTPRFALMALLAYLPIKLLHELAHGLAVRHLGGPRGGLVREAGVTWMLGFPMPYVDASAASSWPERGRRMLVSAAGILLELAVAALALACWLVLDDGLPRELAFAAFTLGTVSTLVFNANPLQRLDGYFLLTDALQLPNLAPRSRAWWMDALRRHLLRATDVAPMPVAAGERPWLAAYAPLAWIWGLVIAVTASAWLAGWSAALGLVAMVVLAGPMLVRPAWRIVADLRREAGVRGEAAPRLRMALLGLFILLAALLVVPMPRQTVAQGVIWPTDHAQLRADTEGFVSELAAADGQAVQAGDLVLTLANPRLAADHEQQAARVRGLSTQFLDAAAADGERGANLRAELQAAQAELARLQQRLQGLQVRAATAGRVALPDARDLPGQWIARGQLVGQVLTGDAPVLRVAVPDDQARGLRQGLQEVRVQLADDRATLLPRSHAARLLRDGGGAVHDLPSAALSQQHGGALLTDPADDHHRRSLQPVVLFDLQLAASAAGAHVGSRGWARFDQGWSPWGWQLADAAWRAWQRGANPER
jgi:putative peptide zinc metalloprotease protein